MKRKVLFVDDDQILQRVTEKSLSAFNDQFELVVANDGFEAIKILEKIQVSLVCMDLIMPRMDGMGLLSSPANQLSGYPCYRHLRYGGGGTWASYRS